MGNSSESRHRWLALAALLVAGLGSSAQACFISPPQAKLPAGVESSLHAPDSLELASIRVKRGRELVFGSGMSDCEQMGLVEIQLRTTPAGLYQYRFELRGGGTAPFRIPSHPVYPLSRDEVLFAFAWDESPPLQRIDLELRVTAMGSDGQPGPSIAVPVRD